MVIEANKTTLEGLVIVADDQQVNLEALKENLAEIGVYGISKFVTSGQDVIDMVKARIEEGGSGRPVLALLLDFHMPRKNGLQVVHEISLLYETANKERDASRQLQEPEYVFLSAMVRSK